MRNLSILEKQGYVESIHEKVWKIDHKAAVYTLANEGIAVLRADKEIDLKVLHGFYRNKTRDEFSRNHCLETMKVYNALSRTYPQDYIFSQVELLSFPEMPVHRPDLYITVPDSSLEYLLRLEHNSQPYLTRKCLTQYVEHLETDGWPTGHNPGLLFVMKTSAHVTRFIQYANRVLDSLGVDASELTVSATTFPQLVAKPYSTAIWSFVGGTSPAPLHE